MYSESIERIWFFSLYSLFSIIFLYWHFKFLAETLFMFTFFILLSRKKSIRYIDDGKSLFRSTNFLMDRIYMLLADSFPEMKEYSGNWGLLIPRLSLTVYFSIHDTFIVPSLPPYKMSSSKWRVTVSGELMLLENYGNCGVTITVALLLWRHKTISHYDFC